MITKSPSAAILSLFFIVSHGVKRSLNDIDAKSCIRGAPSRPAAAQKAGTPGMTSTAHESENRRIGGLFLRFSLSPLLPFFATLSVEHQFVYEPSHAVYASVTA